MFVQILENKPFKVGVGQTITPITTLKDENANYAYIVKDNNNYVLYRKDTKQYYTPTHLWFPEAVAVLSLLPPADRLPIDEAGHPIPPELGELPEYWNISRDTPGIFILVQYRNTGQEIGSRELTGKQIKAKSISGVTNAYTVLKSEGFPHTIGMRITHDPVRNKVYIG